MIDKWGRPVTFRLNENQQQFYKDMWNCNCILKARQLGFSTFIAMYMLDVAVFNSDVSCGIIDARLSDAQKKLAKIMYAYERLPQWLKDAVYVVASNKFEVTFSNGSSISVGTSHRGGTLQYLHISELGKIAAKHPEKAREIRTGALNTIQSGCFVFIESTAEGQEGDFFDICQEAELSAIQNKSLTPLDMKFHFYPWYKAKEYDIPDDQLVEVVIPPDMQRYFSKLQEEEGVELTPGQQRWYVTKKKTQKGDMKREYPATPKEAFEAEIEGAIFGQYMTEAAAAGRIGKFPVIPGVPVHTFWDIGRKDYNSIWFAQVFAGKVRCVHFYQNVLQGMPHYAEYILGTDRVKKGIPAFTSRKHIAGIFADRGWVKGTDVFPHDGRVTEWGSDRSRIEQIQTVGLEPLIATDLNLQDGINAARATIELTEFDEEGCSEGLRVLRLYRWEWDDTRGAFRTGVERHDKNSHGAAAYRYLGTTWRNLPAILEPKPAAPSHQVLTTNDDGSLNLHAHKASDIIAIRRRMKELERTR